MDNLPYNGDHIKQIILHLDWSKVHFYNTMVDRITNHRKGDALEPLTEPLPATALAVEDVSGILDVQSLKTCRAFVHIRPKKADLAKDYMLKFSIVTARMKHLYFGLDNFWVCQFSFLRLCVRLLKSVKLNITHAETYRPTPFMALAAALTLRYLTPSHADVKRESPQETIFVGQIEPISDTTSIIDSLTDETWDYVPGLTANLSTGKYEFDDGEHGRIARILWRASQDVQQASKSSSDALPKSPLAEASSRLGILSSVDAFDLTKQVYALFAADVAALYHRLVSGKKTAIETLQDVLRNHQTSEHVATKDEAVEITDVHTHLFPPSHGNLMLCGVNELLTYHYPVKI
ncbi:hypothetical protein PsorP6_003533 [Peronosclerospora sorghi]|uniref:Uncharacterized protein n=1 Tax=Peronosclerospora sorghi TaxID=230839 RepID=A0ACC0VQN6_9STRA|nr:hypothetical protein PsorP6_003533 [Peronosclerospora sorghi]